METSIMPAITEILDTCSDGQPESPSCLLSCASGGALLVFLVLRNHTSILLPSIAFCLPAKISFIIAPEEVPVYGLLCLIAKIGLSPVKVILVFR